MAYTRRELLRRAGHASLALGAAGALEAAAARAQTVPEVEIVPAGDLLLWRERTIVSRPASSRPEDQILWCSLMRVDDKLSRPIDRWYLWFWTHDAPVMRLYTAPAPTGPYTERRCDPSAPPAGFDPEHWSSGDVAWDPLTRRFYSTPHSRYQPPYDGGGNQPSFCIASADGVTWRRVKDEPIVDVGPPGSFDDRQANYGRFLRDMRGNMVRLRGKVIWYYRGQHEFLDVLPGIKPPAHFQLGGAWTRDLVDFTKSPRNPIMNPAVGSLFALGSAIYADSRVWLMWSVNVAQLVPTMFLKRSPHRRNAFSWSSDGPGALADQELAVLYDGGALGFDQATGRQYMVYGSFSGLPLLGGDYQVHLATGPAASVLVGRVARVGSRAQLLGRPRG